MSKTSVGTFLSVFILAVTSVISTPVQIPILGDGLNCDTVRPNYRCRPELSQNWGQYSPWFSGPSQISLDIPPQCKVTFAQVISRHGSRYPLTDKSTNYSSIIDKIHDNAQEYRHGFSFLKNYRYNLHTEDLTKFGEKELVNSGMDFFNRYEQLAKNTTPFIRASALGRVLVSAQKWVQGYQLAKSSSSRVDLSPSYPILVIGEEPGINNTLHNNLCEAFRNVPYSRIAPSALAEWAKWWVPSVQAHVNANLPGANLSVEETIFLMDLCPYETVASPSGIISPFCDLFTNLEWQRYNYHQSLKSYYGPGAGNPLGPTQGVGFTNELIARLTNRSVQDNTCTNRTLDQDPRTFPLGHTLYADFSHDNDMTSMFFAMGLYKSTPPLSNTTLTNIEETKGYSAAYTVPFAARIYIEKLRCTDYPAEEMVRMIVNNRVQSLETCGGDNIGRCTLSNFIRSLSFAANGGRWNECRI